MTRAVILLGLAIAMMGGGAACGRCGNTLVSEHLSPDSANALIIYEKGCGPMTGFSTHVDLVSTPAVRAVAPEGIGNVLQADADAASLGIKVRWIDAKTVELTYRKVRINLMRPEVNDVDGVAIKHVQNP
jgi:hypothetical protein